MCNDWPEPSPWLGAWGNKTPKRKRSGGEPQATLVSDLTLGIELQTSSAVVVTVTPTDWCESKQTQDFLYY